MPTPAQLQAEVDRIARAGTERETLAAIALVVEQAVEAIARLRMTLK